MNDTLKGFLVILGLLICVWYVSDSQSENNTPKTTASTQAAVKPQKTKAQIEAEKETARIQKEKERQECMKDLKCWADENYFPAESAARPLIERYAKWDFEWTDSWLERKFTHYRWHDKEKGHLLYMGDKVKFQNGFGAWGPMTYTVAYDPKSNSVLSVKVHEGRIQ